MRSSRSDKKIKSQRELSDNVISRMREPSSPVPKAQPSPPPTQPKPPVNESVSPSYAVNEDELRRKIAEELALEQARREVENKKRLEQGRFLVHDEIGKALERERTASTEQLTRAVLREKAATEEERIKAKSFAKKLEEKERELKKHDEYYKDQLARLEERSAQFYKVTTEEYQKAATGVEAKFKRYEAHPICADLQAKILQCYQQNPQQSLSCSALASQYLQCVSNAKQTLLGRGG
ncbi:MICOS complex subunit MIC19 isoform X2 [Pelobates cultripes]|uniref:MICOS complex subunit MIC19 isoform X2 n=1 Tax=Pelobates cultripes TaxID=61616 RepID=A0AAD1RR39_PELCU|nr:MICOS complex subunit MIC19 isoform X2 [Pelobates cultripes]CAH2275487.1 MICOS complex subunit MIC19 isoform X2 [Pelobates cultripes]